MINFDLFERSWGSTIRSRCFWALIRAADASLASFRALRTAAASGVSAGAGGLRGGEEGALRGERLRTGRPRAEGVGAEGAAEVGAESLTRDGEVD